MFIMGIIEVLGVASILPFMQLVAEPDAIDKSTLLNKIYHYFNFASHKQMLIYFGVLVMVLITITNLFAILTTWLQYSYSWGVAHNLSTRLLKIYINKPYHFFLNTNTSDLTAYTISEVNVLTNGFIVPIIEVVSRTFVSLIIFGLLLWVDLKIALIMFGALGGAYLLIYLAQKNYLKRIGHHRINMNLLRYKNLQELLTGIKTVMVYNRQQFFYNRFSEASKEFCEVQPKYNLLLAAPRNILELLAFGSILSITFYLFVSSGNIQSAIPRLSLYAVAGYRLLPALQKAFSAAAKLRHNYPVFEKLYDDLVLSLQLQPEPQKEVTPIPMGASLKIDQLDFTYPLSETPILTDFNLEIQKGQTIAFIGSTGSGKTTLIDLIVGLLQPTHGKIQVGDTEIVPANAPSWRASLAYVPQEVFLFDDTITRNITLSETDEEVDFKHLEKVTKIANIFNFIREELSDGFQTTIGENGVRLSGGQRQRIGLARALYFNPEVLVLDEATSALDSITEQEVINSLKLLPQNITTILIAHRLSTVRHADQIYILKEGKIVDQGTYRSLMESNDTFKTMIELS
ncbi:MAG: ABC transporter ATP-binding protein [Bacteroidota bacterium]